MNEKQFVVNELEILNEENEWKGEYWWAVVNTQRVEDCFECRNKEVALRLCDFLNKATDDFKWQIRRCEKWSAKVKQLQRENNQLRQELNGKDCRKCGNYCRDKALDYCLVDEREPSYFSPLEWDYKAVAEKCKYYER